jgi:hypothetical protein
LQNLDADPNVQEAAKKALEEISKYKLISKT